MHDKNVQREPWNYELLLRPVLSFCTLTNPSNLAIIVPCQCLIVSFTRWQSESFYKTRLRCCYIAPLSSSLLAAFTHSGWYIMATISQTTFTMYESCFIFYWNKVRINIFPALVQIMAWNWSGDKPLSEAMVVDLLTPICVTRPQLVNHTDTKMKLRQLCMNISNDAMQTCSDAFYIALHSRVFEMKSKITRVENNAMLSYKAIYRDTKETQMVLRCFLHKESCG